MKKRLNKFFKEGLYPEEYYELDNNMDINKIEEALKNQCTITGEVNFFDEKKRCLGIKICSNIMAEMPWEEITYNGNLTYYSDSKEKIPKEVYGMLKRNKIIVKVIEIKNEKIIVSRRKNIIEATEKMKEKIVLNNVIYGKISAICNKGLFIDIGEGITAFCPTRYVSKSYIHDMTKFFCNDPIIKVRIVELEDGKITVSRRDSKVGNYSNYKPNDNVTVKIGTALINSSNKIEAYFAEIEPDVSGIVKIQENGIYISENRIPEGKYKSAVVETVLSDEKKMFLKIIL